MPTHETGCDCSFCKRDRDEGLITDSLLKKEHSMDCECCDCLWAAIHGDEDMATVATAPDQKKYQGRMCSSCGALARDVDLCTILGNAVVGYGTANSRVECWDMTDCRLRQNKDKKSGNKDHPVECLCGLCYKQSSGKKSDKKDETDNKFEYTNGGWVSKGNFVKCRHEATPVFSLADINFYGGSESKVEYQTFDESWLVVSLLGFKPTYTSSNKLWSSVPGWDKIFKPYAKQFVPGFTIDWPDYGIPPVKAGFWNKLLVAAKQHGYKNILFYCIGGHGRTGTALSSVLVECGECDPAAAVEFVRKQYCKEAVESDSQVKFLQTLYVQKQLAEITPDEAEKEKK